MDYFQENQNELRRMEMLRAALPYIPVSMQKFLNIYIGFEELFNAIKIIKDGPILYMDSKDYQKNKLGNTDELVNVLRTFCSPKENEMIDMFFNMSNMMSMYDQYKDMFSMLSPGETKSDEKQDAKKNTGTLNPAVLMNIMNQFKGSSEIDDIFKNFSKS